jgi:hypothetical protein
VAQPQPDEPELTLVQQTFLIDLLLVFRILKIGLFPGYLHYPLHGAPRTTPVELYGPCGNPLDPNTDQIETRTSNTSVLTTTRMPTTTQALGGSAGKLTEVVGDIDETQMGARQYSPEPGRIAARCSDKAPEEPRTRRAHGLRAGRTMTLECPGRPRGLAD